MSKRQYSDNASDKPKREHKTYTEEEKAAALTIFDACGGALREAARKANVPIKTLHDWTQERGINEFVRFLRTQQKTTLLDIAEKAAYGLAEVIFARTQNPSPFDKTSELSVSFGIIVDKILLLKGEPTSITESLNPLPPADRRDRLETVKAA